MVLTAMPFTVQVWSGCRLVPMSVTVAPVYGPCAGSIAVMVAVDKTASEILTRHEGS